MKSLLIGLGIFLFTFSGWTGTFVETFDDNGDIEKWQELIIPGAEPGSWKIIDGELHATSPEGFTRFLVTGDERWQDYVIEVDVKPLEKHGLGNIAIAARVKGTWAVGGAIGDLPFPVPVPIATCFVGDFERKKFNILGFGASPLLELEQWSTLKLRVDGNTFTFWLNNEQILETVNEEADLLTGGVGLGLANYTARFDNMVITGNGIPNKGKLSVAPQAKLATTWGQLKRF